MCDKSAVTWRLSDFLVVLTERGITAFLRLKTFYYCVSTARVMGSGGPMTTGFRLHISCTFFV